MNSNAAWYELAGILLTLTSVVVGFTLPDIKHGIRKYLRTRRNK